MQYKIKVRDFLAIISLTIIFTSSISNILNPLVGYGILTIWVIWGSFKIFSEKGNNEYKNLTKTFLKGNFVIKVVIHIYTIFLILYGLTESRFLSANIQTYLNSVSALCIFYICKENTLKNSMVALSLTFLIAVAAQFSSGYIRVHDISFGAEYVLLYYLIIQNKLNTKNIKWLLLIFLILFISNKDIQILGFIAILFLKIIYNILGKRAKKILLFLICCFSIIVIYGYLYLVLEGDFFDLISKYNISTSGRVYYYRIAQELADLSVNFLGYGRNAVQILFGSDYSYLHVGNIHSDILRMYVECGFWIFALWIFNYFVYFPRLLLKKYGISVLTDYIWLLIFTFICYLTDNTELYIVSQYFFMLVLILSVNNKSKSLTTNRKTSHAV